MTFQAAILASSFTDADPRPATRRTTTRRQIDWGDGTKEPGQVVINEDGGYLVYGTHAYRPGTFTITTTIQRRGRGGDPGHSTGHRPPSPTRPITAHGFVNSGVTPPEGVSPA